MTTALVGRAAEAAACKDRLDLVDAAFGDVGPGRGAEVRNAVAELRDQYCPHCPIERQCFAAGMAEPRLPHGGGGVWGGASANQRARALNHRVNHRHLEEK